MSCVQIFTIVIEIILLFSEMLKLNDYLSGKWNQGSQIWIQIGFVYVRYALIQVEKVRTPFPSSA